MAMNMLLKGGSVLVAGNGITTIASFIRNVILARILSVEDYGIATLFAFTMSAIEMISNVAVDKIIIQDRDGNKYRFQGSAHLFLIFRGIFSAIVIFLFSEEIANFFNIPNVAWAFEIIALVPLMRGFLHLDISRYQRDMKFMPYVISEVIPQVIILILAYPFAIYFKTYESVIWLLIVQSIIFVFISHYLSERKYALSLSQDVFKRIYVFGWPLLVNSLFMFAILQGDKFIVGSLFTMELLALYSTAFLVTLTPAMIISKLLYSLYLPWLSSSDLNNGEFKSRCIQMNEIAFLFGVLNCTFFIVFGQELIVLIFGDKYEDSGKYIFLLAIVQFIRILKASPYIIAIAKGRTKYPMYSNILRGLAFIFAYIAALNGASIEIIIFIGGVGEFLSYLVSVELIKKIHFHGYYIMLLRPVIITSIFSFAVFMQLSYSNESYQFSYKIFLLVFLSIYILLKLKKDSSINLDNVLNLFKSKI